MFAASVLLALSVAPLASLLVREASAWRDGWAMLAGTNALALLARSLLLSALVTALALLIGVPLGVLVGRTDVRGARVAALVHAFPMFLPPFLLALGWFHLFGANGLLGSEATSKALFSGAGLFLILALTFAPVVTVLVALGLQAVDPSLEEAARVVARPRRVIARILLPSAAPSCVLAAIIVFTLSFSELGVPMFLRVDTFPAAVFARLGGVDYAPGEAIALVLPLVPLAILLLILERRFVGSRSYAVLGLRSRRQDPLALGQWRTGASLLVWCMAFVSLAPIAALGWRSARAGGLRDLGPWLGNSHWTSLASSAVAATMIVGVGLIVGHAAARRLRGSAALDAVAVLAFVAPAAVLGVGLMGLWNRPALQTVYGSAAMLVVGFVSRYAVIGVRSLGSLIAQTPVQIEEAAAAMGAGFWRRLVRILLPLHARGIGVAWLLAFVFCLRDLELSVLYYPAGGQPLTVRIFTLEANGPPAVVAGLAVVHVAMTAAVLGLGGVMLKRGTA